MNANGWFCLLAAAVTFGGLGLVVRTERIARDVRQPDPDHTDYQQRFNEDERRNRP